jgi:hypothetical protein
MFIPTRSNSGKTSFSKERRGSSATRQNKKPLAVDQKELLT